MIQAEVFAKSCVFSQCHSAEGRKADLDLSTYDASTRALLTERPPNNKVAAAKGLRLVNPGAPETSFLYRKLVAPEEGEGGIMPKKNKRLEPYRVDAIREWIVRGARTD